MGIITQNGQIVLINGSALTYGEDTPTSNQWVRPAAWPDLSQMDVSGGNILYMTSYADEARGFCSFSISCTGSYTVEVGTISGSTFTADSTQTYASNTSCELYYGSANGTYKVLRVTGTAITKLTLNQGSIITIGSFYGYKSNQGIIDIVGKLPSGTGLSCSTQYNLVNVEIDGLVLSGSTASMFYSCYSLASVNVSSWDTSAVTNMNQMFTYCYSLTSLDVSGWDTSAVTNMSSMFLYCYSLASLDVSSWDTSAVTNMNQMFGNCYSLASLDVSSWDTGSVTNMSSMFGSCCSLTSLDVSDWDTSAVTNMGSMFVSCYSLTSLDVSSWDTSAVTNMGSMFSSCRSLTSLDVSSWDTGIVTIMSDMFSSCSSLTSLDVSEWDTSSATNMGTMFQYCYSLTSLDVSGWDTSAVTNMSSMFFYCGSLTSLDVSKWDFSLVTTTGSAGSIFRYCRGLWGSLTLPATMGQIGNYCFEGTRSIYEWHFKATTPPALASTNAFTNMTDFGGKKIYVPQSALSAYQTAENWSTYASYMVGE